ncbi:hypothetical protein [Amycolatopsis taiwanensis]|uniref:Uncharacterized protein n=1 Tax=Amycolatopsis taiwanensis TaxID=342230 RepID=A0A9W6VI15_9PSEU|nr:hypothetical protein [Amycolatopsis taiwanensis]GLY67914.1 hypothetical protein Atai01_45330 [Amycolatopsis taiwanensis]
MVRLGFELFVNGNLTLDHLSERLYQRGLRARPTARYPTRSGFRSASWGEADLACAV